MESKPNCEVVVVFTGIKTGKSTFLEAPRRPTFYGVSIVEQDECLIDTGYDCNCKYLKMYRDYLAENVFEPLIILAATNFSCWEKNFSDVYRFPRCFYSSYEWYQIFSEIDEEQRLKAVKDMFSI